MGMNNPAATLFWLAPSMGVTLCILSMIIDGWGNVFRLPFFYPERIVQTILFLVFPGVLAFCMVMSEYYIIQRTGVLPMSIAGIFKEVLTLSASAYVFGDHLNPVNLSGVIITFFGIGVFIYHKYRKSLESKVPLDAHGNPIPEDDPTAAAILKEDEDGDEEEQRHLPRFVDGDGGEEANPRGPNKDGNLGRHHVLFSASDLDTPSPFEGEREVDFTRAGVLGTSDRMHGGREGGRGVGVDAVVRESLEIQRQWRAQSPSTDGR